MLEFSVDFEIMIYNVKHDFKQVNIEYVFAPLSVYQTYVDCGASTMDIAWSKHNGYRAV